MALDGTTMEGMFKDTFGELVKTTPEFAVWSKDIPYKNQAKVGKNYIFPVQFRRGHGITLQSGATSLTAFTLNAVKSGQSDDASVSGSTYVGRESFAYKAVASATGDNKYSFTNIFMNGVEDLVMTANFYKEALIGYGQTSFGIFNEVSGSSTTATLDLTAASSAPGLWAQMEGAYIDVYSDTAFGTKRNSNAVIEVTGIDYDPDTGVVALSLLGNATDIDAIALGDVAVPRGWYSSGHKSMAGLDKILTNSASIFGIDPATYPAWGGTQYSCGSTALTFAKLIKACVAITVRCGMVDDVVKVYCSPATWTDLNNNHAALRRFSESTKASLDVGTRKISYYSVTGSVIEITPHPMCKQGEAFVGITAFACRGGVTDVTFDLNAGETGQNPRFLMELADAAGFEIRCMWDLFVILEKPKAWVKLIDIVNSF
jgi:hypothetical protein